MLGDKKCYGEKMKQVKGWEIELRGEGQAAIQIG